MITLSRSFLFRSTGTVCAPGMADPPAAHGGARSGSRSCCCTGGRAAAAPAHPRHLNH